MLYVLPILLTFIASAIAVQPAYSGDITSGSMIIENPWSRATPKGAKVGAGYLNILNIGNVADRLVSAQSDISARVEIHTMKIDGGVMKMRKLSDGLVIAPKSEVALKPGGYHLMFMGLKEPLKENQDFNVILTFKNAGQIDILFKTGRIGGSSPYPKEEAPSHTGSASGSQSGTSSLESPIGDP